VAEWTPSDTCALFVDPEHDSLHCRDCWGIKGCEHAGAPTGEMVSNGQTDPLDSSRLLVVRLCPDCGDRVEFSVPKSRGRAARYGRGYYRR